MVVFQNVCKQYIPGIVAVEDITFTIHSGEFVFIVGASGAGKSTITKMMIHEEKCDSGSILVNNFNLSDMTKKTIPLLRRSIGMVFQDFRLLPNKTVYENVAFAMEVIGSSRRAIRRRVPEVLHMVGLTSKARSRPNELSGGEQQRVGLARALANNPRLIVADEPTGNLDNDTAMEIMSLLNAINKNGTTIIMVTHSQNIVDDMQKRVIAIESGRIIRDEAQGGYSDVIN